MPCSTIESPQQYSKAAPSEFEPGTEAGGWLGGFRPAFVQPTEGGGGGGGVRRIGS